MIYCSISTKIEGFLKRGFGKSKERRESSSTVVGLVFRICCGFWNRVSGRSHFDSIEDDIRVKMDDDALIDDLIGDGDDGV